MPRIVGGLLGLELELLAGILGEEVLIKWVKSPYYQPLKRLLSRYLFRGVIVGLVSWHAKILSVNQDLGFHSPYVLPKEAIQ